MEKQKLKKTNKCYYFSQGKCRFGNSCKFSHDDFIQLHLIRHAESIYNQICQNYEGNSFFSQIAKNQVHLDQKLIDCGLTQKGREQASQVILPRQSYSTKIKKGQDQKMKIIDFVFVSPLNRALQTAQIILQKNKIKTKNIIVLPELSQVLSKVCDFSLDIKEKQKRFSNFNFELLKAKKYKQSFWQDDLLDNEYLNFLIQKQKDGKRYMKILQQIFPTPLESSERCFERVSKVLKKIQQICNQTQSNKILIVSHNRILKYMHGRWNNGRAPSFNNCELRRILL